MPARNAGIMGFSCDAFFFFIGSWSESTLNVTKCCKRKLREVRLLKISCGSYSKTLVSLQLIMTKEVEMSHKITHWLRTTSNLNFILYSTSLAFCTYFCMYAFRKPFSVGTFAGSIDLPLLPPMDYKILLIIAQVFGYMLSKFWGIKFVSESKFNSRGKTIMALIIIAELALLGFALTPKPFNILFLFINGIPLGMIWGLVFGYLEGRNFSDILGAGLSASFIVASGVVKSVGKGLMNMGVSEFWMPFATGLLFLPLMFVTLYFLNMLPPPTKEEEDYRTKRDAMTGKDRKKFFFTFAPGLTLLVFLYMFLTAFRDFRDNFARELWDALGFSSMPEIFALSEIPIAVCVLGVLGMMSFIRSNQLSFNVIYGIMIGGAAMIGVSTMFFELGIIGPAAWMILIGLGVYLAYVPFGCILFDNLIAIVGFVGTSGFMIYVSDAFGYLGSISLMLYKNFGKPDLPWLEFFTNFSYLTSILCCTCFVLSIFYFNRVTEKKKFTREDTELDDDLVEA